MEKVVDETVAPKISTFVHPIIRAVSAIMVRTAVFGSPEGKMSYTDRAMQYTSIGTLAAKARADAWWDKARARTWD